jgi:hypothetical protein
MNRVQHIETQLQDSHLSRTHDPFKLASTRSGMNERRIASEGSKIDISLGLIKPSSDDVKSDDVELLLRGPASAVCALTLGDLLDSVKVISLAFD